MKQTVVQCQDALILHRFSEYIQRILVLSNRRCLGSLPFSRDKVDRSEGYRLERIERLGISIGPFDPSR